jgi:hypothetical protein
MLGGMSIEGKIPKRLRKEVKVEERAGGLMSEEEVRTLEEGRGVHGVRYSKFVSSGCGERSMRGERSKRYECLAASYMLPSLCCAYCTDRLFMSTHPI